ncbi:MAG: trehalase family glycosidase, partial [Acutalibacteraceae bacterium]|nr:trehalase family glycosidase [Acutalibacteraceae bacterium]
YDDLAKKVAETYIKLIDENFAKTGNLWEKYNGLDGTVANEDYNAPKMMGWTAGMYMYFSRLK